MAIYTGNFIQTLHNLKPGITIAFATFNDRQNTRKTTQITFQHLARTFYGLNKFKLAAPIKFNEQGHVRSSQLEMAGNN